MGALFCICFVLSGAHMYDLRDVFALLCIKSPSTPHLDFPGRMWGVGVHYGVGLWSTAAKYRLRFAITEEIGCYINRTSRYKIVVV